LSTVVTQPRGERRRALASTLGFLTISALAFVAGFALPYYTFNERRFDVYWPHRWWLLVHASAGIVAVLSGPVQLWFGLTGRRMEIHRTLGKVYMASIAVGSISGVYLAVNTTRGIMAGAGLLGLALAWAVTTAMAYLAIRRHLYEQHKEWMIRSYVVTFAFITARIGVGVGVVSGIAPDFNTAFAIGMWTSWTVPLLVTEVVLQGRKILAVHA
jgi:hypothetical protein